MALKCHDAKLVILESNLLPEELDDKEKFYISYFCSNNKEKGYNIVAGGNASGKRGVEHINAAFNQEELEEIIDLLLNHRELSLIDIANKYNVEQNTILAISKGKRYYQPNLIYPLRNNDHFSTKKDSLFDYFESEQELLDLKSDLKYRWDLTIENDLLKKYKIPLRVLREIN